MVREGLRALLELAGGFDVVGEASDGREAVELVARCHPQVVVMDTAMPRLNGFEATRQILLIAPETCVLAVSAHGDDRSVEHMAAVGAAGYVVKQNAGRVLIRAIREVANGRPFFSASILARLGPSARHARHEVRSGGPVERPLTRREAEVLQLVAEGASNKQIAAGLGISIKTVEKHRQQLMDKLNIHETAGLTRHAIATGAIESSTQGSTTGAGARKGA